MSSGPTGVWALQSGGDHGIGLRGPLLRVDTRTNRVRARVPLHGVLAFGVLARGESVWIWGSRDVLRVDSRTDRMAQRIRVSDAHGELRGLAVESSSPQPRTGASSGSTLAPEGGPARSPRRCRRRRCARHSAVGSCSPRTAPWRLSARARIAWCGGAGWASARAPSFAPTVSSGYSAARDDPGDRLTALEPARGDVRATQLLPAFGTTGMVFQGGRLWLAAAGDRLLACEARARAVSARGRPAERSRPRPPSTRCLRALDAHTSPRV